MYQIVNRCSAKGVHQMYEKLQNEHGSQNGRHVWVYNRRLRQVRAAIYMTLPYAPRG
jgi:hypothetical protein